MSKTNRIYVCLSCQRTFGPYATDAGMRLDAKEHRKDCPWFNPIQWLLDGFAMQHRGEMNRKLKEKYGPKPRKPGHKRRRRRQRKERT